MHSSFLDLDLTYDDKISLITNDVTYILKIIYGWYKGGIIFGEGEIEKSDDEFLKLGYRLISHNPETNRHILHNLIKSSYTNDFDCAKKYIQLEALHASMTAFAPISDINIYISSFFGLDFKQKYQDILKEKLPDIYDELFIEYEFMI